MVLFAYHNQSAYNKLMFIFAAKDFNQAYKRLKYLQQFGAYRERQADHITGTEKDLNDKTAQLDKNKICVLRPAASGQVGIFERR